jgi:MFS family permease
MRPRDAVRRLALGRAPSGTGSGIAGVALSYLIYERTGSAIWLAGTLFFTFGVTGSLTPLAGKIADRYDRRLVMIASDLLSLATWLLLVFVREPIFLAAIGFVASVVALPFGLAASAASRTSSARMTCRGRTGGCPRRAASRASPVPRSVARSLRARRRRACVRGQCCVVRAFGAARLVGAGDRVLRAQE